MKKLYVIPAILILVVPALIMAQTLPVPGDTLMLIRLDNAISTKSSRIGQPFAARVVSPDAYRGAIVHGHVENIESSGRLTGRTQMSLAFDSIAFRGETRPIRARLEELRQSESVKVVDSEGRIVSGNRSSQTIKRSGIGAAVGGVLGGLIGGRKGLLVGLLAGGGAGAGSLAIEGAQELRLDPGSELEIRTLRSGRQLARTEPGAPFLVRQAQETLNEKGYDAGNPDGVMGSHTRAAIRHYQQDNSLAVTGELDRQTLDRLGIRQ